MTEVMFGLGGVLACIVQITLQASISPASLA